MATSAWAIPADRHTVVGLLQAPTGINWVPYASNSAERQQLFDVLADIVIHPTGLTAAIQKRALAEAGKFAPNDADELPPAAAQFYTSLIEAPLNNPHDIALRYSLVESIKNADVPESVGFLIESARSADNLSNQYALNILNQVLAPDSRGIPPAIETDQSRFNPKPGLPLSRRLRSADWIAAVERAVPELDRLLASSSTTEPGQQKIQRALQLAQMQLQSAAPAGVSSAAPASIASASPAMERYGAKSATHSSAQTPLQASTQSVAPSPRSKWLIAISILALALFWGLRRRISS